MAHLDEEIGLSAHAREMRRWDTPQRDGGTRPDTFQAFPKMLYRAETIQGRMSLEDQHTCRKIVRSEAELAIATGQGWSVGPDEAKALWNAEQDALGQAAAEKSYGDRRMSPAAQREAEVAEQANELRHLPEHPVEKRKPGRPRLAPAGA